MLSNQCQRILNNPYLQNEIMISSQSSPLNINILSHLPSDHYDAVFKIMYCHCAKMKKICFDMDTYDSVLNFEIKYCN